MTVEDRLAILDEVGRYSLTLDGGDDEGWVQLFTEDAVWESVTADPSRALRFEGHDAIRAFAAGMRANGAGVQVRHNKIGTVFLELTDTSAHIRSNGLLTSVGAEGPPRVSLTGVYDETYRKVDGAWRLARCTLEVDPPAPRP